MKKYIKMKKVFRRIMLTKEGLCDMYAYSLKVLEGFQREKNRFLKKNF